jgi:predicted secreted protein with PEFG-CTERM motif
MGPNNTIYLSGIRTGFPEGGHAFFAKSVDGGNSFNKGIDLDLLPESAVPEFPFAIPVLLISIVSIIVFYKMRFRK